MQYELRPAGRLSFFTIAALVVAIASFVVACCGYGFAGLMICFAGMLAGIIGFLRSHAHGVRDAAICLLAIAISVFDLVPSIWAMVRHTMPR